MAHSPHRRWKGCPMCKDYKFRDLGQARRKPIGELRKIGKKRRVSRGDLGDQ